MAMATAWQEDPSKAMKKQCRSVFWSSIGLLCLLFNLLLQGYLRWAASGPRPLGIGWRACIFDAAAALILIQLRRGTLSAPAVLIYIELGRNTKVTRHLGALRLRARCDILLLGCWHRWLYC
jgi:hypothetical protein